MWFSAAVDGPYRSRGCQRNRHRIAAQHHEGNRPPNGLLRIDTRANQLGNVADLVIGAMHRPAQICAERSRNAGMSSRSGGARVGDEAAVSFDGSDAGSDIKEGDGDGRI
jgi:hypothetical protein